MGVRINRAIEFSASMKISSRRTTKGMNALSALLVVIALMLVGIGGFLLAGGRYHVTVFQGETLYDDTIYEVDRLFGAVRYCRLEGIDKYTCRRRELIDVPEPQAPPPTKKTPPRGL